MDFDEFPLVQWLMDPRGVRYDLANSSAPSPDLRELGADLYGVPLGYDNVWGFPALRTAVAEAYDVDPSEIALTSGTQEASFLTLACLVKPGDRVAAETPSYPPIYSLPKALGCRLLPLRRKYENEFAVDLNEAERAFKAGAKALCVTNPHNPSGKAIGAKHLAELCQLAEKYKSYVIVDEIYKELLPKQPPLARHVSESAITVSGVAKMFGMGGVRVGWAIAPPKLVKRIHLAKDYISVSNSTHGETIAIAVLKNRRALLARARRHVQTNLELVEEFMRRQRAMTWVRPDGANISFPRLPKGTKSVPFCKKALKRGVLLAPGLYLGQEGHVRLTFGCKTEELKGGLAVLKRILEGK
jgi:aspartate/methionine/tyrosine aminotransferase